MISIFSYSFALFVADGTCEGVTCSSNAQCLYTEDNSRKCVCNSGYDGDGESCSRK